MKSGKGGSTGRPVAADKWNANYRSRCGNAITNTIGVYFPLIASVRANWITWALASLKWHNKWTRWNIGRRNGSCEDLMDPIEYLMCKYANGCNINGNYWAGCLIVEIRGDWTELSLTNNKFLCVFCYLTTKLDGNFSFGFLRYWIPSFKITGVLFIQIYCQEIHHFSQKYWHFQHFIYVECFVFLDHLINFHIYKNFDFNLH